MCSVMLLSFLLVHLSSAALPPPGYGTGQTFVLAFPENIAYYHPRASQNKYKITALYNDTQVFIGSEISRMLSAGQTQEFNVSIDLEMARSAASDKTLNITSTKRVTIQIVTQRVSSMQTMLATASNRLGTRYLVPPVPSIEGTTLPVLNVTRDIAERGPFRLFLVNADQNNQVNLTGGEYTKLDLEPLQVGQQWVNPKKPWRVVEARQPLAVLFGHACAISKNCSCGQLMAALPPAIDEEVKVLVPPILSTMVANQTFILVSDSESPKVLPYSDHQVLTTNGSAMLYHPGLLLPLIPEVNFSACSVINTVTGGDNYAVIMIEDSKKEEVHLGSSLLDTPWQALGETEYVSAVVLLEQEKNIIWHPSSTMAVYFMGSKNGVLFGNPAPVISTSPDHRGCAASPEEMHIGKEMICWRESIQFCEERNLSLVSFSKASDQEHVYHKVSQEKPHGLQDAWIGMRRSSQTGQWYWLSEDPVEHTEWAQDEPGTVDDGQCAMMSLEGSTVQESWRDEDCCKKAQPICYRSPALVPL